MRAVSAAKPPMSERTVRRLTIASLVVGFASAIVIYFVAGPAPSNPLGYEPLQTKSYVHELELVGGKANVMAEQFRNWFVSLWQGKQLAVTVAILTVFAAALFRRIARPQPSVPPTPPKLARSLKRAA